MTLRTVMLTVGLAAVAAPALAADAQLKPFVALGFAGETTFVPANLDQAAGNRHTMFGIDAVWLRDIVGVDVDVAHGPGFFEGDEHLVLNSSVTTATGNVVITLPRRWTEYVLRPYVLAGAGIMHLHTKDNLELFPFSATLVAIDFGAGATGMITARTGLSWEVRRFGSLSRKDTATTGLSFGPGRLSFWRASIAFAYRY